MKVIIPELKVAGRRLGRNLNHDKRSLRFLAAPATVDKTVSWLRRVPVFDQGDLGSCTGNAEVGCLGSNPFFDVLPKGTVCDEALAVKIYSAATRIDPYAGFYPPQDTGSDGLSVSKAALAMKLISGYVWATNVDQAKTLIQQGPFIIGTEWTTMLDSPDAGGFVANPCGGSVRGGHEYQCFKRDVENDRWWFYNSWGDSWGMKGMFCYDSAGLAGLMQRGGDITQSVPLSAPAPTPTPIPSDPDLVAWWTAVKPWATPHTGHPRKSPADKAAHACLDLAAQKQLI